jgi:hypothetical protein
MKLALGDKVALSLARDAHDANGSVVTAASTLVEILRGEPRDAAVHRVIRRITVASVDQQVGREAGELLGRVGLSGHQHALDALLAVVALGQPRPVVLLTSDPGDLGRLTEEPQRPARERVAVVRA